MNSIYKSGNALIIKVSSEIYSKEAVSSTCYKYLKDYFINQLNNEQEKCIEVTLELYFCTSKSENLENKSFIQAV